jgi:hypothetical protein
LFFGFQMGSKIEHHICNARALPVPFCVKGVKLLKAQD